MMIDWMEKAVPQTAALYPYVPGKVLEQLLREKGLTRAVKLASNENPYGPSPKAIAALQQAAVGVHRYPDADATELKEALACFHQLDKEQVIVGNGSNEVLELLIRTFAGHGDEVIYSQRGFIVYSLATQAAGATGVVVPEADGLSHDLDAMAKAVNAATKVICIANPNNPTGTLHRVARLQSFLDQLRRDLLVIIDEAYYEFVAAELGDSVRLLKHPGLVISRTFSKAYGLAGCRVGYALTDAAIAALVNRFREPFNVSSLAQLAAVAALQDGAWVQARVADCVAERTRLEAALQTFGLYAAKSNGNFVLLRHSRAAAIAAQLENRGIIPRPLAPYTMPDYLRISVGTVEENNLFLAALSELMDSIR
ncbi:MAG: histidinol-phosphate transaminase [Mariprofundus sp.]|nr:histidinol-phosphate transaminase [Mariprofundus sp.]